MAQSKLGFWVHLTLVIVTSYIVITYFFEPHDNDCQMTFMMEPPKFIPIPIDTPLEASLARLSRKKEAEDYRLFMYSEYGFPHEGNVRRDLKDAMPILFVPGNAGSYQQVRSLASTCIRLHLQSLEAFKFVFYTIDFRAELSGLDGDLIERQMRFVHSAVRKIIDIHPAETNGVILVGHSVGGFIAKALLTNPDFDRNSVPMLINLASPSTKPFINFDDKMKNLYDAAQARWEQQQNTSNTLTVSISGGTSDRLVPAHLSLDPQYDISLTTSSIDDVWLTTDHVSITWCRELMKKLAGLLSALMDKRKTRLIEGKENQVKIAMSELLTDASDQVDIISIPTSNESVVLTVDIETFVDSFVAHRNSLIDSPIILDVSGRKHSDLLLWVEHIESFKKNNIYGCQELNLSNHKAQCVGKFSYSDYIRKIPSRRYELKKKSFIVKDQSRLLNYLVMDFNTNHRNGDLKRHKVPESISVQSLRDEGITALKVPGPIECLLRTLWQTSPLAHASMPSRKQQVGFFKLELVELYKWTQHFSVEIKLKSCSSSAKRIDLTALLVQDGHIGKSFHQKKDESFVIVRMNARRFVLLNNQSTIAPKTYLEIFMDGSCSVDIDVRFDLWSLVKSIIQRYIGHVLILSTFAAYISAIVRAPSIFAGNIISNYQGGQNYPWLAKFLCFIVSLFAANFDNSLYTYHLDDSIIITATVYVLALGSVALIEYFIDRIVDLAIIINKFQMFIRDKVLEQRPTNESSPASVSTQNGNGNISHHKSIIGFDYLALFIVISTVMASFVASVLVLKTSVFLIAFISRVKLSFRRSNLGDKTQVEANKLDEMISDELYILTQSMTTISFFSLLCNIPAILLKLSSTAFFAPVNLNLVSSSVSYILVKLIYQWLTSVEEENIDREGGLIVRTLAKFPTQLISIAALAPIMRVWSDISTISYVDMIFFILVVGSISRLESRRMKKKKMKVE